MTNLTHREEREEGRCDKRREDTRREKIREERR